MKKKKELHFFVQPLCVIIVLDLTSNYFFDLKVQSDFVDYLFRARSMATATATVAPTIGLLPMPRKPIIST